MIEKRLILILTIFRWQDGWGEYKTEIRIVRDNEEDLE